MRRLLLALALAFAPAPAPAHAGTLPAPEDAELPTADRFASRIHEHLGATATARVELCTAPDGHVTSVHVVRGSRYAAFDRAVVTDITGWQFTPAAQPHCFVRTIAYHTSR